jgi:hypothetical protein
MSSQSYNTSQQFAELDYKSGAHLWFSNLDTNSPWGTSFQLPVPGAKKEVGINSQLAAKPKAIEPFFSNDFVQISSAQRWNTQSVGYGQAQAQTQAQAQAPAQVKKVSKLPPAPPAAEAISNLDGPLEEENAQNLYKTELCRSFEETGTCRYGLKCQFAHGRSELRHISRHPKYKTEVCKTFHTIGTCPYGKRCRFIHIEAGLALPPTPVAPLPTPSSPVKFNSPMKSQIKAPVKTPAFENSVTNGSLISNGWSSNWNGAFPLTTTVNFNPAVKDASSTSSTPLFPPLNSTMESQERSRLGIFQQFCS